MTTRRRKTAEGDEWSVTLSKKNTTLILIGIALFVSGNPVAQKAGSWLLGVSTPVSNIEEIKAATTENSAQIKSVIELAKRTDEKVSILVVETERLKVELAARLSAQRNP